MRLTIYILYIKCPPPAEGGGRKGKERKGKERKGKERKRKGKLGESTTEAKKTTAEVGCGKEPRGAVSGPARALGGEDGCGPTDFTVFTVLLTVPVSSVTRVYSMLSYVFCDTVVRSELGGFKNAILSITFLFALSKLRYCSAGTRTRFDDFL